MQIRHCPVDHHDRFEILLLHHPALYIGGKVFKIFAAMYPRSILRFLDPFTGNTVEPLDTGKLTVAEFFNKLRRIFHPLWCWFETVRRIIHIKFRIGFKRVMLIRNGRIDDLVDDQAFACMRRHIDMGIAGNEFRLFKPGWATPGGKFDTVFWLRDRL